MEVRGLLLLGCLAIGALAGPTPNSKRCDIKCIEPSGFARDRTYIYSYQTETSTFLQREAVAFSNLTISCQVRLEVLGTCDIALSVYEVAVTETDRDGREIPSPNQREFATHLSGERLLFGMQGGIVTTVCRSSDEPIWVANFKRGILSALQRTMPSMVPGTETVSESTVTGTCPTVVTADDTTIHKTKDFAKCEGRYNMHGQIPGIKLVPYAPSSDAITSSQTCQQEYVNNRVTGSFCEEKHILVPISDPPTGPVTTVRQTLTFRRISKNVLYRSTEKIGERSSILFDHSEHMMDHETDPTAANEIVAELCLSLRGGVDTETARLFPALIHEMRRLESSALASVLADAECGDYQNTLHQLLADALGECQSNGCVEIMVNLIKDNTVTNKERIQKWIVSLNFVEHPTKEMVSQLMELADFESIQKPIFLAVSSIIHRYCAINPDCEEDIEVSDAMDQFDLLLGSRCLYEDKDEKRTMMIALHAIGNTGLPRRSLKKCYVSESTDVALRVAAMQATQQMPCETELEESLARIMEKTTLDSELRISAYKALMACPSQELLDRIAALLEEEKTNQVGAYIVSNMKNLQDSNDPLKTAQRAIVQNHEISAKFLDDPMKFSHNAEWSWYNETTGYGLNGEGDIIFSSNSFIPRQVSVKGGFDAFGYAFEAFELGGRMEGMQRLIESVFRPETEEEEPTRQRRSLIKESKLENVINNFEVPQEPETDGNIYIKVFGREVLFMDAEDMKAMFQPADPTDFFVELALLAAGKSYEISKNEMMLERKMSVPMVNGLEMEVSVNASTVSRLNATGKLDIMGMVSDPRRMDIDGTLQPSYAMDVSCLMEVDAHCARTGVHYELSAHTATSFSGKLSVENGNDVKLKMRAPEQRQELFSFSSRVEFLHQEQFDIAPSTAEIDLVSETICTGEFLEDALGAKLCGESRYHRSDEYWMAGHVLSGTYEFSLYADKVEADLTSFDIEASYNSGGLGDQESFDFFLGTPGTAKDRTYGLSGTFNTDTKVLNAALLWPNHHSEITVDVENEEHSKGLQVRWLMGELEYTAHFTYTDESDSYHASVGVVTPRFGSLDLEGSVIKVGSQINLDVSLQGQSRRFVTLNGVITEIKSNKKTRYTTGLTVGGEYVNGSIDSTIQIRDGVQTLDAALTGGERSIVIAAKHNSRSEEGISHDFFLSCGFSHSPERSFRLNGDIEASRLSSTSDFKFCYGQTTCIGDKKIMLSHSLEITDHEGRVEDQLRVTLQHPAQDTHLVLSQDLQNRADRKEFTVDVTDHMPQVPKELVATRLGMIHETTDEGMFGSYEVSLTTDSSVNRMNNSFELKDSGDVSIKTLLQLGQNLDVTGVVSYTGNGGVLPGGTRHNVDARLSTPSEELGRIHFHVETGEGEGAAELGVYGVHDQEKLFLQGSGTTSGSHGSVDVRAPFIAPSDFSVSLDISRDEGDGFSSTLSLTLHPDEDVYSLYIEGKNNTGSNKQGQGLVEVKFPTGSIALGGNAEIASHTKKFGLTMTVTNLAQSSESVFGIGVTFDDKSDDARKSYLLRIETTAPDHQNAVQLSLYGRSGHCSVELHFVELDFITRLTYSASEEAFAVGFNMTTPDRKAYLGLNHTSEGGMFHPHLSVHIASSGVDLMQLDVDLVADIGDTMYGKNSLVVLKASRPDKTVTATTGVTRTSSGLNYHFQLSDNTDVAIKLNLSTAIGSATSGRFVTDVSLAAVSDYLQEIPVTTGIHLERGEEDVIFVVFFNTSEPLFHFNVTKSMMSPSPNSHSKEVSMRVKLPTSVAPSLHEFGMHFLQEERVTVRSNIPIKDGSISFFWGPSEEQQLTISSASTSRETVQGRLIEGSLVVAQPLRTAHLQPEYSIDYAIHMMEPGFEFSLTFERENEDSSVFTITHLVAEKNDLPNYLTTVSVELREGKSVSVRSDITHRDTEVIMSNFLFNMQNGDRHEEAELDLQMKKNLRAGVNCSSWLTFTHSPSGAEITALTDVQINEQTFYTGIEGSCSLPSLDSPLNFGFITELNKETQELSVHAQGPVNDIMLRGRVHDVSEDLTTGYRLETENFINGVARPLNAHVVYYGQETSVGLTFETDEGDHTFSFGYLNESSIQASLSKGETQNAQSTLTVLNPHTLYSLTTWETDWPETVKETARNRFYELMDQFEETKLRYQEIGQAIKLGFVTNMERALLANEELVTQMQEIGEGLREKLDEIRENYQRQRQSIENKFANFSTEVKDILVEEFKVIGTEAMERLDAFRELRASLRTSRVAFFQNVHTALIEYKTIAFDGSAILRLKESWERMKMAAATFREENYPTTERLGELLMGEVESMAENWDTAKDEVRARWGGFTYSMSRVMDGDELESLQLAFLMSPAYRDTIRLALEIQALKEDISSWMEERRISAVSQRNLIQQDLDALREMKRNYRYVKNAPLFGTRNVDMSFNILENFFDSYRVDYNDKITELAEWVQAQYRRYSYSYNITEGRIEVWFFTDERFDDLVSKPHQDPFSKWKVFGARLSQDFPLIDDLRQFKSGLYEDGQLESAYFDNVAEPFWNAIYNSTSGINLEDIWEWYGLYNEALYKALGLQCPSGEAALLGDQHYRTFDGTHYAFAGKCSFLLAQDFVDNSFTVAVEYGREENVMSKSFVVISDGVTLEIKDGGVFIGRDQLEFPYDASESLSVSRDFSSIYIRSTHGFRVTYNLKYDILTVNLGLLYYGKTAGLFGNFNYEPEDDFLKPNGQVVNRDTFARSWEIGKQCTSHLNKAIECDTDPSRVTNLVCGRMFLDALGPASMGHPAVDPKPFYVACVNTACRNNRTEELKSKMRCSIFQSYIDACKHKGLAWLEMPRECVRCLDDAELSPIQSFRYDGPPGLQIEVPRGADIVVILEEQPCMEGHSEALENLMTAINRQLGNENYRDNRIGLVGFGGAGNNQEAHILSFDGELFGEIPRLSYALSHANFDGNGVGDVWGAISLAMDYPYRAGVAKHVFLMACTRCTDEARFVGSARIQRTMKDQGVRFTVLMEEDITLQKEKKNENKIFGHDESSVFTSKLRTVSDIENFKGDTSLLNYITKPKNPCTDLAMATDGAVFSTNSIENKPFQNVFSLWVVKNSQVPESTLCTCVLNKNGVPQSVCLEY